MRARIETDKITLVVSDAHEVHVRMTVEKLPIVTVNGRYWMAPDGYLELKRLAWQYVKNQGLPEQDMARLLELISP
jgi:hypothetical protein